MSMAFVLRLCVLACQGWEQLGLNIPGDPTEPPSTSQVSPWDNCGRDVSFLHAVCTWWGTEDRRPHSPGRGLLEMQRGRLAGEHSWAPASCGWAQRPFPRAEAGFGPEVRTLPVCTSWGPLTTGLFPLRILLRLANLSACSKPEVFSVKISNFP